MHKLLFKQVGAIMVVGLIFAMAFAPTGLVFAQQPHTVEGLRAQIEALQRQLLILQLQAQIAELQRQIVALRGERPLPPPTPPVVTPAPTPTPTPHVDRSLGFWSIERAAQPSAFPGVGRERSVVVLRDEASWNRFWADSRPGIGPVPAAPRVDFPREMVVAAFMGVQSTGGHSIEVTGIIERENVVEVLARERSPGPGEMVAQALTLPRHVVATIQSHKPVVLVVDPRIHPTPAPTPRITPAPTPRVTPTPTPAPTPLLTPTPAPLTPELFERARDARRMSDLHAIRQALSHYMIESPNPILNRRGVCSPNHGFMARPPVMSVTNGWSMTINPSQAVDGTGWIPVNLQGLRGGSPLARLPVDPTGMVDNRFYLYGCRAMPDGGLGFALVANLEYAGNQLEAQDGGVCPNLYETGTIPRYFSPANLRNLFGTC